MISQVRIKDHWTEQRMFFRRSLAAGVIILVLVLALLGKLVQLQIVRHEYYADLSTGNRVRIDPVPPNRGLILDRKGAVLAENRPAYQLELIAEQVPDIDDSLRQLAALALLTDEDLPRLQRLIKSRRIFESVPLRLQLTDEEVARFAVNRHDFPGIDIRTRLTRYYPNGTVGVHALGYVAAISEQDLTRIDQGEYAGTTLIGKIGLESAFERELHGTPGFRQVLVNAQGRPVELTSQLQADLSPLQSAMSGNDLILSLDLAVQRTAEEALKDQRGAVVAIDPNNGDVIAFASTPGFDPNPFGRGLTIAEYDVLQNDIDRPLFNRALRGVYPPGSTIKPMIALAALESQSVDPVQIRYCKGFFTLPGSRHRYRDWKPEGHGWMNLQEALAQSCDTYFYSVAQGLGIDKLSTFMGRFGLGRATGIDIEGEKTGLLPSREWKIRAFSRPADRVWFPGDTVNIGIGQGYMLATPLQLAHMAATIGMRGKTFEPRLVSAIREARTGEVRQIPPQPSPGVDGVDPARWKRIIDGMVGVTTPPRGTARGSAAGAPYSIAAKTGTAQVFSVGQTEKYDEKTIEERLRDHALFVAFAPAEAPRVALAVLVENGRSGSGTAAPVARKVMDAYLVPSQAVAKTGEPAKVAPSAPAQTPAPAPTPVRARPAQRRQVSAPETAAPSEPASDEPMAGDETPAPTAPDASTPETPPIDTTAPAATAPERASPEAAPPEPPDASTPPQTEEPPGT